LAAGCQSSGAKALSRYQDSKEKAGEVAQVSHETPAGLPGAAKRRADSAAQTPEVAFEMGEKALQQFYRDRQDKPAHLQRARVNFEEAAKADPTSAAAQHRLAIIADLQERFSDSERYYRTAASLEPTNANIAADLGWSYILQGRWQDAEQALQRALQLDPGSKIARDHLATCRQQQAGTQLAASGRGASGQMMANRPATVGSDAMPSQAPQNPSQSGYYDPSRGGPPMGPDHMGEYLRHQLAQIDHRGAPPTGQPLMLDSRPPAVPPQMGQLPQYGPAPGPQVQPSQIASAPPQYGGPFGPPGQAYQPPTSPEAGTPYRSDARPSGQPFVHIEPNGPAQRSGPANGAPGYGNMASNGQQPRPSGAEWPAQGNSSEIQRIQAIEAPVQPDQAMYQAPALPSPSPAAQGYPQPLSQQQQGPPTAPPTGFGPAREPQQPQQQQAIAGQAQGTAVEKARRDAALMGLGLGPGQMFSNLEQPGDRMAPGSNSRPNGAAFGSPPIQSPDLTPPPDLRQMRSFFEQSPVTPPTNSMGQAMPGGTSNMMTPGSVNDPNARFQREFVNPAAAQMPQAPSAPNVWSQGGVQGAMQGYDDSRRATDSQLQQTLQNTWAATPSGAIPSPSGGVPMAGPSPQSQMMNDGWARQPVAPAPYSQAAPPQSNRGYESAPLPVVNPSAGRMGGGPIENFAPAGRVAQPQYRQGVRIRAAVMQFPGPESSAVSSPR